jgi:HPt (histidine-containing phosphotransfer) domain-containing protein
VTVDNGGSDDIAEDRLRAVVESIGGHARSANLSRADRLSEALAAVAAGSLDESARREATEVAHQLVGSAGTFGFPEASQLAGEIERYFVEADLGDPVRLATARDQVRRVQEELAAGPD